ncbi:MAG: carbohydrate kinase [Actinomycetaceae bacterium]|nr:carbohydrate kinase [Actinomycetaceae bacterium]
MRNAKALVVGEALVDIVVPKRGDRKEIPGGSPANVALTLGRLDRDVQLLTWLGQDARGNLVKGHLEESNVRVMPESMGAQKTSTALATLDETGAATYEFDIEWQVPQIEIDEDTPVVHAGSIAATLEPGGSEVVQLLARAKEFATISYDPNARPSIMGDPATAYERVKELISLADVVKTSDEDIEWLSGSADIDAVAQSWLELGASLVVVTRGGEGSSAFISGERIDMPAADVKVVDTVGAGDSFMGGLIDALWSENMLGSGNRYALANIDRETVVRVLARASSISAITVSRAGANPPWKKELA